MNAQCTATSKRTGNRCLRPPMRFQKTCDKHGGKAPQALLAAQRREVVAQAQGVVAAFEHHVLADPVEALLAVGQEFMYLKDELRRRAGELQSLSVTSRDGVEQVAAVLQAYQSSLVQVADVLTKINRLNLTGRRDAADKAMLDTVVQATRNAIYRLDVGLDDAQCERVLLAIGEEFSKLRDAA